jgi:hypothetical protein
MHEEPGMNRRDFVRAVTMTAAAAGYSQAMTAQKTGGEVKPGLYSITYLGVWYRGDALTLEQIIGRAKQYGYQGIEVDGKRPHGDPLDMPTKRCQ